MRFNDYYQIVNLTIEGTDETEIRAHANEIARVMKGSLGG